MAVTNYYTVNGEIIGEKTAGSTRVDYLTDALGSVTATVNQSAQIVNTYRYKPYGSLLAKTGTGPDPAFGWVGTHGIRPTQKKFSDFSVNTKHYGDYTAQWTSNSQITFTAGKINSYVYADANPVLIWAYLGIHAVHYPFAADAMLTMANPITRNELGQHALFLTVQATTQCAVPAPNPPSNPPATNPPPENPNLPCYLRRNDQMIGITIEVPTWELNCAACCYDQSFRRGDACDTENLLCFVDYDQSNKTERDLKILNECLADVARCRESDHTQFRRCIELCQTRFPNIPPDYPPKLPKRYV